MIAVLVMDLEQLQVGLREGARAAPAYPGIHPECAFAITRCTTVGIAPRFEDHLVQTVSAGVHVKNDNAGW